MLPESPGCLRGWTGQCQFQGVGLPSAVRRACSCTCKRLKALAEGCAREVDAECCVAQSLGISPINTRQHNKVTTLCA